LPANKKAATANQVMVGSVEAISRNEPAVREPHRVPFSRSIIACGDENANRDERTDADGLMIIHGDDGEKRKKWLSAEKLSSPCKLIMYWRCLFGDMAALLPAGIDPSARS
jgi:hypothetical protein